jgi:hypothetical protein
VLILIQHTLGRYKLENFDFAVDRPSVRPCPIAKLILGLGKAHIDADLAAGRSGYQKLQRNRGFPGTGAAFEQMQPVSGKPAVQNEIQAVDARRRSWQVLWQVMNGGIHRSSHLAPADANSTRRHAPQAPSRLRARYLTEKDGAGSQGHQGAAKATSLRKVFRHKAKNIGHISGL